MRILHSSYAILNLINSEFLGQILTTNALLVNGWTLKANHGNWSLLICIKEKKRKESVNKNTVRPVSVGQVVQFCKNHFLEK